MTALLWATQAVQAEGFEYKDPVPLGFHNLFVLIASMIALLWAAKVVHQLWFVAVVHRRLASNRALTLDRMSLYAKDFQQLIRQHFNQILRMRRTVPPQEVARHCVHAHLRPESLEVFGSELLGIRFTVDSRLPCEVRLYWGVPLAACERLLQQSRGSGGEALPSAVRSGSGSWGWRPASEARWPSALAPLLPQGPGPGPVPPAATVGVAGPPGSAGVRPRDADPTEATAANAAELAPAAGPEGGASAASSWEPLAPGESILRSAPAQLAAGLGIVYSAPPEEFLDTRQLPFDAAAPWPPPAGVAAALPLVVTLTTRHRRWDAEGWPLEESQHAHSQVTLVRFHCESRASTSTATAAASADTLRPEVLQQVVLGDGGTAHRVLGVFGFESGDEEAGDAECMICYDRPRSVVLLPCRHCSVCPSCLRSLRDEQCPLCRSAFSAYLLLPLLGIV